MVEKSFKMTGDDTKEPPDDPGNPTVDFHGEKRTNEMHESNTAPDARLARKGNGKEAKLSYSAHALMANRNGLIVDLRIDLAGGCAVRRNALAMLDANVADRRRIPLGADKGYDTRDFVAACPDRNVTRHIAQTITKRRRSRIDERTAAHRGYAASQRPRKRVEEISGWLKMAETFGRPDTSDSAKIRPPRICSIPSSTYCASQSSYNSRHNSLTARVPRRDTGGRPPKAPTLPRTTHEASANKVHPRSSPILRARQLVLQQPAKVAPGLQPAIVHSLNIRG
jgi:hypothetical protein